MNKYKRIVSGMLCTVLLLSTFGCAFTERTAASKKMEPMEIEEVATYGFDFLGGKDVMPVSGFWGPTPSETSINGIAMPDYVTDEIYKMIADCGVNLITFSNLDYSTQKQYVQKMLELCEKYKIGTTIYDEGGLYKDGKAVSLSELDDRISEYSHYPAFCGVYVIDEPTSPAYNVGPNNPPISTFVDTIHNLEELGVWAVGALLPCYSENYRKSYDAYVEEWLTTTDIKTLEYDYYPFDKTSNMVDHFYNLSVIREKAEKYNLPFWVDIGAGGQWNDAMEHFDSAEYYPTEGEFTWNVNTSLAYGAKGISYFPIIQPYYFAYAESQPYDFERNGLIGACGNKTRWWYYAKNVNAQIAAVDSVLMNAVNKGVIITSEQAKAENKDSSCIMEGTSWRELADVQGDAMIGCFNYQGKSAYYVVNYDREYAQKITLQFYDKYDFSMTQETKTTKMHGNGVELTMRPGEGVLIVME